MGDPCTDLHSPSPSPSRRSSNIETIAQPQPGVRFIFSWRFATALLLHTSFIAFVFMRTSMSIAVVCMATTSWKVGDIDNTTSLDSKGANETEPEEEFIWTSDFQGLVLSSFSFLRWLAPLIPLAIQPYVGLKTSLLSLTSLAVTLTLLTPVATRTDPWLLLACRILIGATFGSNVPAVGEFLAWWAPSGDKQTMFSIAFSGPQIGKIVGALLSGYLCTVPFDHGWPLIFYANGAMGLVWVVLWQLLGSRKPEDHKYISQTELLYIQQHRLLGEKDHGVKDKQKKRPPFKTILTSVPVLTFLTCTTLYEWTVTLFFNYQTVFLADVLGFSAPETGMLMAVFSVVRFVGVLFWTWLYNRLQACTTLSTTATRKLLISIGQLLSVGGLVTVVFLNADERWIIVAMFFLVMFGQSTSACILLCIPQDLAPRYAGTLSGLHFCFAGIASFSAPLVVAHLTPNNEKEEWNRVWMIKAGVLMLIFFIFLGLGDSSLQPWAEESPEVNLSRDHRKREAYPDWSKTSVTLLTVKRNPSSLSDVIPGTVAGRKKLFNGAVDSRFEHDLTTRSGGPLKELNGQTRQSSL